MVAVKSFAELEEKFFEYITDIMYCTMTTVDKKGRPRARVLLPIWQVLDGRPLGWLATYKTPVKTAHLARNPHATFSYWSSKQNVVHIDTVAEWVDDLEIKREVWDLYCKGSPPSVGYDPKQYWDSGPEDPEFDVLRLDPWRVQVVRGTDLASRIWQAEGTA